MKLQTIIGLEFHVQLRTDSKMFCACRHDNINPKPNQNICPICLGYPGTLPTVNRQAVALALKAALALSCRINLHTKFDRKNYFYPDLPKGYQISQFDKPLAEDGEMIINYTASDGLAGSLENEAELKRVGIIRLHLEEDSGKSSHSTEGTLIDFDRGGAPLIEIVSAPHLSSPSEAKTFAQELQLLLRHLDVSSGHMENGELRCDANISLRPVGDDRLYPKTEIKNINSFKAIEKALTYEISRQTELWLKNTPPTITETRGWDENKNLTVSQREKESLADYRYFPEPDLPPLLLTEAEVDATRHELPELPQAKRRRFTKEYFLKGADAKILTENPAVAAYFESVVSELRAWLNAENDFQSEDSKLASVTANWLINKYLPLLETTATPFVKQKITAENFAELLTLLLRLKLNSQSAQELLKTMAKTGGDPSSLMAESDLSQSDSEADLIDWVKTSIAQYPAQAAEYRAGKEPLIKFFLGVVMKISRGKANPQKAEELLKQTLTQ